MRKGERLTAMVIHARRRFLYSKRTFMALNRLLSGACAGARIFRCYPLDALALHICKLLVLVGFRSRLFLYLDGGTEIKSEISQALRRLERRLHELGKRAAVRFEAAQGYHPEDTSRFLFATSFVAEVGGHSRLLHTYLRGCKGSRLLVSGEANRRSRLQRDNFIAVQRLATEKIFGDLGLGRNLTFDDNPTSSPYKKGFSIYTQLTVINPELIILFSTVTDVALLFSVWVYRKQHPDVRVLYYHHADDYFPFFGDSFDAHIDIDANQDRKCAYSQGRYLIRISVPDRIAESRYRGLRPARTVFAFVNVDKMFDDQETDCGFCGLVTRLRQHDVHVILATPMGKGGALRRLLLRNASSLHGILIDENCIDIAKYRGVASIYLDTFPIGGGMSVVDALSMSLPVAINSAPINQVFRDPVLKHFMFSDVREIMAYVLHLCGDHTFYASECATAYKIYRTYYSEPKMVAELTAVAQNIVSVGSANGSVNTPNGSRSWC